jgi:signal transduction histidine kinase
MPVQPDDTNVRIRLWGEKVVIVVPQERADWAKATAERILREPFTARPYAELCYLLVSSPLAYAAAFLIAAAFIGGTVLAITFIGIVIFALGLRVARGLGGFQRGLARSLLHEEIENPDVFTHRAGLFGWIQGALRDRIGWRAVAYFAIKVPLSFVAIFSAFSLWWDAFACLFHPVFFGNSVSPSLFGLERNVFSPGFLSIGRSGPVHAFAIFISGLVLLLAAPWGVRAFVYLDRLLVHGLLGPDSVAQRMRSLEEARTHTVDASAATLRRIERDLHDGTQAQLVALAMRLGMAKEKLEAGDEVDLDQIRTLVDGAHRGAKEAIVELRDLARGIHPPALDVGLEGALSTLSARSTVPSECTVQLTDRPTPAIESIAYFCVAELLSNVAQHAQASRATITAVQSGQWLRLVVRDDGVGGADLATVGTSSSGLSGLTDRVHAVDGHLYIDSPLGGPTVVTVDLPLHA